MSRNCSGENRMGFRVIAISLAAAMSATAFAAPSCPAAPVLPPELADWARDAPSKTIYAYGDDLGRSEEHTSELQSLMRISYAVFCLKKKKQKTKYTLKLHKNSKNDNTESLHKTK